MISLIAKSFVMLGFTTLFAANPSSTNFSLKSYDLGGSGGGSSSSSNYNLNGEAGAQSGATGSSSNYSVKPGEKPTQNANVPTAPNLTNPSSEYNRLRLVINTSSNPSDALYAIAISSNDFATTQYVKSDNSIGSSLALTDYQTYTSWGGGSGFWITGLSSNTTYKVKVKAMQGKFSESAYGPATGGVATVLPTVSFGVTTSPASGPPYNLSFTSLSSGSVVDADKDAELTLSTNALFGGSVYIKDSNAGLTSASATYTISSTSSDLSTAQIGYGAIINSASQSSGGPFVGVAPFNGVSNNVGGLTTSLQTLATTSSSISGGDIIVRLKAKASATTPSATDYTDALTFVASMLF